MDFLSRFTITLLPNRVSIYTFDSLSNNAFELIKTLLYHKDHFASFTISEKEISLITDVPIEGWLIKDPSTFRIFEFHEGGSGINHCGIAQSLSQLFSSKGIEILYNNTFNKNFIIVNEEKVEECNRLVNESMYP